MSTDRLVVVDLETFGLDPEADPVLEAGFAIVSLDLKIIDEFKVLIWEDGIYDTCYKNLHKKAEAGNEGAAYVLNMHIRSKLWEDVRVGGMSVTMAEEKMLAWLDKNNVDQSDPLCGSSVGFDRSMLKFQFPDIESRFGYRNIDISSIKELCLRYNPRVADALGNSTNPRKLHRVMPDIDDTLGELRFYLDNFLWVGEGIA